MAAPRPASRISRGGARALPSNRRYWQICPLHWKPIGHGVVALHWTVEQTPPLQICPLAQTVPAEPHPLTHDPFTQTFPAAHEVVALQVLVAWQVPAELHVWPAGHGTFGLHCVEQPIVPGVHAAHWPLVQIVPLGHGVVAVH